MNENQKSDFKDYSSVSALDTNLKSIINGVELLGSTLSMLDKYTDKDFRIDGVLCSKADKSLKECNKFFSSIESLVKKNPDRVCNVKDNCEKSEKEKVEKINDTILSFMRCFHPVGGKFDIFDMFNEAVKGDEEIKGGICAIAKGSACMKLGDIKNFLREKKSYIQMFVNDICEILGYKSKAYLEKSIEYRDKFCYLNAMSGYKLDVDAINTEIGRRVRLQSESTRTLMYSQFNCDPVSVELNRKGLLQKVLDWVKNLFVAGEKEVEKPLVPNNNDTNKHNSKDEGTLKKEKNEKENDGPNK